MKTLRQILKETVMLIESSPIEDSLSDVLLDLRADGIRHSTTNEPITSDSLKNMARRIHRTDEYHNKINAEERGEEHTPTDWSDLSSKHRRNYIGRLITGINLIKKYRLLEPRSEQDDMPEPASEQNNTLFNNAATEYISSVATEPVEPGSAAERMHRHALVGIIQELSKSPSPYIDPNAPGRTQYGNNKQTSKFLKSNPGDWISADHRLADWMIKAWMGPARRGPAKHNNS